MTLQHDNLQAREWGSILSRRDWVYLLSLLIPVVIHDLALKGLLVCWDIKGVGFGDALRLMQSDLLFNLGYALLWVGLFAVVRRQPFRWIVVGLFHVITIVVVMITTIAFQYFRATGSTLDSHYLLFWLSSYDGTGGAIAAEVPAGIVALLLIAPIYGVIGPPLVSRFVSRWLGWSTPDVRRPVVAWVPWLRSFGPCLMACGLFIFSLQPGGSAGASKSFARDAFVHLVLTAAEVAQGEEVPEATAVPSTENQPSAVAQGEKATDVTAGSPPRTRRPEMTPRDALPAVTAGLPAKDRRSEAALLPTVSTERRNVVLIFLESTRATSTTPYNKDLHTTPFLDELAKSSVLVERAYTMVPHTHNALTVTNCGVEPPLEPRGTVMLSKPARAPKGCLPHLLSAQGYNTVYFMSQTKLFENSEQIMENLGYEDFYSIENMATEGFELTNYFGYEDEIMLEPSRQWLEKHREMPFLATYLTSAPHHDYRAPQNRHGRVHFSTNDLLNRYLNGVRNQDFFLRSLFSQYKQLGLYEDTVFVILGDHGEAFGEHGRFQHDNVPYEETLKIPLLIHDPKRFNNGMRVEGPVNQLDILLTVVDLLGYEIQSGGYGGKSLLQPLPDDRVIMFSCLGEKGCIGSLQGTKKYIYHFDDKPEELFDLSTDPGERKNLARQSPPEELNKRRSQLLEWRAKVRSMYPSRPTD